MNKVNVVVVVGFQNLGGTPTPKHYKKYPPGGVSEFFHGTNHSSTQSSLPPRHVAIGCESAYVSSCADYYDEQVRASV